MVSWLEFGTELGKTPARIDLVKILEYKEIDTGKERRMYVYRFPGWSEGESFIGWAGSFSTDEKDMETDGSTFSRFEDLSKKDAETQIVEFMEELKNRPSRTK